MRGWGLGGGGGGGGGGGICFALLFDLFVYCFDLFAHPLVVNRGLCSVILAVPTLDIFLTIYSVIL